MAKVKSKVDKMFADIYTELPEDKYFRMSEAQKESMSRIEVRDKISKAHLGKKDDDLTRAKKSASHTGSKRTAEHAQAISNSLHSNRKPLTAEHKKKLSEISTGVPKFYKRNVLTKQEKSAYKKALAHGPIFRGTVLTWKGTAQRFNVNVEKLRMYASGKRLEDLE
jgi:hypothetical protein